MAPQKEDKPDYDEEIIYDTGPLEKFFHLLTKFLKNITVEPVVFFYSLGFSITMLPSANLYFDKTCKVSIVLKINACNSFEGECYIYHMLIQLQFGPFHLLYLHHLGYG